MAFTRLVGYDLTAEQLPALGVFTYKGTWDADANTPTLVDGTGSTGDWYRVNAAGAADLGSGENDYLVGDFVVYNGTVWQPWGTGYAVGGLIDGVPTRLRLHLVTEEPDVELAGHVYLHLDIPE